MTNVEHNIEPEIADMLTGFSTYDGPKRAYGHYLSFDGAGVFTYVEVTAKGGSREECVDRFRKLLTMVMARRYWDRGRLLWRTRPEIDCFLDKGWKAYCRFAVIPAEAEIVLDDASEQLG